MRVRIFIRGSVNTIWRWHSTLTPLSLFTGILRFSSQHAERGVSRAEHVSHNENKGRMRKGKIREGDKEEHDKGEEQEGMSMDSKYSEGRGGWKDRDTGIRPDDAKMKKKNTERETYSR